MSALNTLALIQQLVIYTGKTYIMIDAWNNGSSSRWQESFPTLKDEELELLGEPFAIAYDSPYEAQQAYNQICQDLAEGDSLVGGWVNYIGFEGGQARTYTFDAGSDVTRPHFENGEVTEIELFLD